MNPNDSNKPLGESGGKQLCRSCAALNEPNADFCIKCGAPLSWYSTIGPFETIFAQGFIYREAAEHPRHFIAVLGIWLIFLPQAMAGIGMVRLHSLFWSSIGVGMIFISVGIIGRTTWNYLVAKRRTNN